MLFTQVGVAHHLSAVAPTLDLGNVTMPLIEMAAPENENGAESEGRSVLAGVIGVTFAHTPNVTGLEWNANNADSVYVGQMSKSMLKCKNAQMHQCANAQMHKCTNA